MGKLKDNVDFYLGCLDKIEEDYKVENYLAGEVEDSLVETDEVFEEEGKTAQGVDRTETAVVVARPGNSGVSWYPSSQNIFEPAEYF